MRSGNLLQAFYHAFMGWKYAVSTQRNARIHLAATVAVAAAGFWLGLTAEQWAILLLAVGLVWTAELANTALEALADLVSPEIHPLVKIAKDVKAGAVVAAVAAAALAGLLIFGPALMQRIMLTVP